MIDFFQDEFRNNLDKFNLRARLIVEGFMVGLHKSPYHGFSVEFSDHRQYNPGDPIKDIDWKLYGKTNKYYIKRFEEETNLRSYILLDHSKSMQYKSNKISKLDYAKALSSALCYLMIQQKDAVGFTAFTNEITDYLPPKAMNQYFNIINKKIFELDPKSETNTAKVFHKIAEKIKKRSLIIIISDLLDEKENLISGLQHFRHNHHEVILFHIVDNQELEFDFKRETEFVDAETDEKLTVNPWHIQKGYKTDVEEFYKYIKEKCWNSKIEYNSINTKTPFEEVLINYLLKRSKV